MLAILFSLPRSTAAAIPADALVFTAEMGSWGFVPGGPRGTGVAKFDLTIVVNGQKVTRTVTILKDDIKAWARPARLPRDSDEDYAQKLADALGTASQAKAKVIAAAINTTFKAEFQQLGVQATSAIKQIETVQNVGGLFIKVPSAVASAPATFRVRVWHLMSR